MTECHIRIRRNVLYHSLWCIRCSRCHLDTVAIGWPAALRHALAHRDAEVMG